MSTQDRPTRTTLYVKTGCPYCSRAREFLAGQNVEFIERNVSLDHEAFAEMKRLSGQDKAPVLVYEGDILSDFDVEELAPFLEKHGAHVDRA
jgi:glutaredoxin 3